MKLGDRLVVCTRIDADGQEHSDPGTVIEIVRQRGTGRCIATLLCDDGSLTARHFEPKRRR
jgi:hypothetical protein